MASRSLIEASNKRKQRSARAAELAAADRARAAFDVDAAIEMYSRLLSATEAGRDCDVRTIRCDALLGRAACYEKRGDLTAQLADLVAAAALARTLADLPREVAALCQQVDALALLGRLADAEAAGRAALARARASGDPGLEADGLFAQASGLRWTGQLAGAAHDANAALAAHRVLNARRGIAEDLRILAWIEHISGQPEAGVQARLKEALALQRELGDILGEGLILYFLALTSADLAQARALAEQALVLVERGRARLGQTLLPNFLALTYWQLGLYHKASGLGAKAVAAARAMDARGVLVPCLETLARCQVGRGHFAAANATLAEGLALATLAGDDRTRAFCNADLGRSALAGGRPEEAVVHFTIAAGLAEQAGLEAEETGILAWLGAAHLALGHRDEAGRCSGEAVRRLETRHGVLAEYPLHEVYWWRYQVLAANNGDGAAETGSAPMAEARQVLDRAHAGMMARIAMLSDEGLRRNYLNKVPINCAIVLEHARLAATYGLPAAEETGAPAANVQDQLRRLMDIAVRMNEQHDPGALRDFILDEAVELNGAEEVALALLDAEGHIKEYALRGNQSEASMLPTEVAVPHAEGKATPPALLLALLPEVVEKRRGILRPAEGTGPDVIAVPLQARGRLDGILYAANRPIFGRFGAADLDLLAVFANQAAIALDNAQLHDEMEKRVVARTTELAVSNAALSNRAAELEIIASLQHGLAARLDFQAMIDLTGDKLRSIFDTADMTISWYDENSNLLHYPYCYEHGERQAIPARTPTPGGLFERISNTRETIVANNPAEYARLHIPQIPGTDSSKSLAAMPIISSDRVMGLIVMENYEREDAYLGPEVRLLTTIAASLGSALQNAHLFDETQRLLAETKQHVAELATVNAVSQAVTSEVELQALIHLIGEQVRGIFKADIAYVALLDRAAGMINFLYQYGEKMASFPHGQGLTSRIIDSAQPLLVNRNLRAHYAALGSQLVGLEVSSFLGVPILARNRAIGAISVQSIAEEDRFDESDVRLLSTIAANVGAALENAALFAETSRRAGEMAALNEMGREISATLDLNTVLERIAFHAEQVLAARDVVLRLIEPGQDMRAVVARGKNAEANRADMFKVGEGVSGHVAESGVPEVINDLQHDPRVAHVPGTDPSEDEQDVMLVVPLKTQERVIGVLTVWRDKATGGPFAEDDLRFAVGLSLQAATAIQNARLFAEVQRQQEIAASLVQGLKESEAQLARIIDFLPDAAFVIDDEGRVIAWNRAIEEMTGVPAKEMLGQGDRAYAVPFYGERQPILIDLALDPHIAIERRYAQVRHEGETLVGETYVPRLRGRDRYLLGTASTLRDSHGKIVGAIENIRDITERKQMEDALRQAKAEAEAATQAKSAFLATMSHEIRTPMNAIIGMSGLLMDTPLDAEQHDFAETIRNSGDALLTIINDILDFSKIEAGKMDLEEQPFDVRECVEASLDLVRFKAAEKHVELAYQVEPEVPAAVFGDVTRLRQVLVNLLSNAVKFTDQGEVVVSVAAGPGDQTDETPPPGAETRARRVRIGFTVRDTGIGIARERIPQLFQAFTQADASTSRRYGGTGLGLAISKRLVELMGGAMSAASDGVPGKGSVFTFSIQAWVAPEVRARPHLRDNQPELGGKRVLIVDDNATNRRILALQVRSWGMLPSDTGDATEALAWVKRGDPFDVGIIDSQMPQMNGSELAVLLRRNRRTGKLPLVLATSLGPETSAANVFAATMLKPMRPSALFDVLVRILAEKPRAVVPVAPGGSVADSDLGKRHPLRVLLAEDNAVNQKLALRLLAQMGYRADVAGNGLEAIQALERQGYDVVLMDVQMPEMDGLEATRHICSRWPRAERPRIIAMTANAMQGDREMCLAAGMDDYISKPIRPADLAAALEHSPAHA